MQFRYVRGAHAHAHGKDENWCVCVFRRSTDPSEWCSMKIFELRSKKREREFVHFGKWRNFVGFDDS